MIEIDEHVKNIPDTFMSSREYFHFFFAPLIEETHEDLLSSLKMVSMAPSGELYSVKRDKSYKPPKDLFYKMVLTKGAYEPQLEILLL